MNNNNHNQRQQKKSYDTPASINGVNEQVIHYLKFDDRSFVLGKIDASGNFINKVSEWKDIKGKIVLLDKNSAANLVHDKYYAVKWKVSDVKESVIIGELVSFEESKRT